MEDSRIAELAKKRTELSAKNKKLVARLNKIEAKLLKEMQKRRTKSIETHGVKVTMVQQERVAYNKDRFEEILNATVFESILSSSLDYSKIQGQVQHGNITAEDLAVCSVVNTSKPYLVISMVEE